ncbi:MAG: hypothetical protein MAG453_00449 [Calditrichaeota bacterium]|nr:hypothetical protein [Calditrichota bacterium]
MMLALVASLISAIYPWNLEAGGYLTTGHLEQSQQYRAQTVYVGGDRWRKDYLVARVNHLTVDGDWYEQWLVSASAFRWWREELKFGADIGRLDGDLRGWLAGPRVEGNLGWIGYAATAHRLVFGKGIPVASARVSGDVWNARLLLRRRFGPFLAEAGAHVTAPEHDATRLMGVLRVSGSVSGRVSVSLAHGFGEGWLLVDPRALTVDLNRDLTAAWYELAVTVRISPHLYAQGMYTRTDYEPHARNAWPYVAQYVTAGFNIRY